MKDKILAVISSNESFLNQVEAAAKTYRPEYRVIPILVATAANIEMRLPAVVHAFIIAYHMQNADGPAVLRRLRTNPYFRESLMIGVPGKDFDPESSKRFMIVGADKVALEQKCTGEGIKSLLS